MAIMAMAGNTSLQSATTTVRRLAVDSLPRSRFVRHIRREITVALLMGLVLRAVSERDRPAEIGVMLVALANVGAHGLNWRQTGGCARVFLDIWGIHTGEAAPGEQLLERLGADWRFFYTED